MSPLLFNLVLSALTSCIQHYLAGVQVGSCRVRWRAFADDLAIYLNHGELKFISGVLHRWEDITGMRVSVDKSALLPLGPGTSWGVGVGVTDGLVTLLPPDKQYSYMGAQIGYNLKQTTWISWWARHVPDPL